MLLKNQVETRELAEALAVASKSMEGIVQNIGHFLPKVSNRLSMCLNIFLLPANVETETHLMHFADTRDGDFDVGASKSKQQRKSISRRLRTSTAQDTFITCIYKPVHTYIHTF